MGVDFLLFLKPSVPQDVLIIDCPSLSVSWMCVLVWDRTGQGVIVSGFHKLKGCIFMYGPSPYEDIISKGLCSLMPLSPANTFTRCLTLVTVI